MLETQRIHLRLFMEGVEVPVISASVSASVGTAATATIQIPGHDSALYILPKTMVHLFYYDWEQDHYGKGGGRGPVTNRIGSTLNTPDVYTHKGKKYFTSETLKDLNYKLMFVGEVISVNFAKDGFGSQTITMACSDCSSVLDTAYLFQAQYHSSGLDGALINENSGFYGNNGNPFDDIISQPEKVVADFIRQKRPKNPALQGDQASIVGGLLSFFEVLLGVHGYSYGLDTFYTVQERRLRLMEQIVSDSGKVAATLFDGAVFEQWVSGTLGNSPAVMSFRDVSYQILNYVFYSSVPNPVGYYKWGSRGVPKYSLYGTTEVYEARAAKIGAGKLREAYLRLDAKFAEAVNGLLDFLEKEPVYYPMIEVPAEATDSEEAGESEEAKVIFPAPVLTDAFRDYESRAKISKRTVEQVKAEAHEAKYAHDQGLAADVSTGLGFGWSLMGTEYQSTLKLGANYWGFYGVRDRGLDFWFPERTNSGFRALVYAHKAADTSFSTPDEFRDKLIADVNELFKRFTTIDKETAATSSDPAAIAEALKAEQVIRLNKDNQFVYTGEGEEVLADEDLHKTVYYTLDFWLKYPDPEEPTVLEGVIKTIKGHFLIVKELMESYAAIGRAVEKVNADGSLDQLSWGGDWTDGDIGQLMSLWGMGWDPVHVQSKRFKRGVMLRSTDALNDDWENRKNYENYTPSVQDILTGAEVGAPEVEVVGEGGVEEAPPEFDPNSIYRRGESNKDSNDRERLLTQIYRPDIWFCPQPICNNIFPDEYSSLTFSRPMMREITRLKLSSYNQLMEDVVVNKYYFAPQFKNSPNLEEGGIGSVAKVVLYPHEIYTGSIPKIQKLSEASFYSKAAQDVRDEVADLGQKVEPGDSDPDIETPDKFGNILATYGAKVAHFHLLTARYASRSGSLMGRFMPRLVAGFPAGIYQKEYDNRQAIKTGLSLGVKKVYQEGSKEISAEAFNATKPIHYQCMIQSVTHTISQQQANTSISFTHARSHKTTSATDDLLSTMVEKGGFQVKAKVDGREASATDKTFSKSFRVAGAQVDYAMGSPFGTMCKEFFSTLFEDPVLTVYSSSAGRVTNDYLYLLQQKFDTSSKEFLDAEIPKAKPAQLKAGAVQLGGDVPRATYEDSIVQSNLLYVSGSGYGFDSAKLRVEGIPQEDWYLFEESPGVTTYPVDEGSIFSINIIESKNSLPWDNPIFLKIPISSASTIAKLFKISGGSLKWDSSATGSVDLAASEHISNSEASICVGVRSVKGTEINAKTLFALETTTIDSDTDSWEGFLYLKLAPKFKEVMISWGEVTEAEAAETNAEELLEPWEVNIRPGWISGESYSNTTIGDTYEKMFGCGSVISHFSKSGKALSPLEGYNNVSTEQAMDRLIAEYQSQSDPIKWVNSKLRRGDANLIEVLGKKDKDKRLEYETSGGFHSAAYGNYSNLEALDVVGRDLGSLISPLEKKIQINADTAKIDPRQSRRNAILYYLSTILSRGIRS